MNRRLTASLLVPLAAAACLCALAPATPAAPRKPKTQDLVWTHPGLASLPVRSIAMLPAATYDNNLVTQRTVAQAIGVAFRGSGHRWLSGETVREMARGDAEGEALLARARESVLKTARIDSLLAPRVCARLRTDALLAIRVDQWEQRALEWNERGRPSTTVRMSASLTDSLGRLLWSASGSETAEGPERDPGVEAPGGATVGREALTNQGGPPSFAEVLTRLLTRWTPVFPARAAPAPAPGDTTRSR